ncbi:fimbrial protein [Salmonella enterica subsp. enterica]|nr:fimbrial protein [Salmonella enterica subsp. enterica]
MSGQMTHLKTILMVLAMMAGAAALPVQAFGPSDSKCDITSGPLPFKNMNLKSTGYEAGDTLQEFSFPIQYDCTVYYDLNDRWPTKYIPTLRTTDDFRTEVDKLDKAGLGLELTITEKESGKSATLPWSEIKNTGGGTFITRPFGAALPQDSQSNPKVTTRHGTLSGKIFAEDNYQAPVMLNIAPMTALKITPDNEGKNYFGTGIRIPSFYIRIFPDNLGVVKISPSPTVDFGRIYATSLDTLTKTSAPFTVTAEQKTGTGTPFEMPLSIEFDTGGLPLTADNQSIILDNGLKLSVIDTVAPDKKITFNQTYPMGTISFQPSTGTGISKTYTAKVEPVSNKPDIKTGRFNAGVTVEVTYN